MKHACKTLVQSRVKRILFSFYLPQWSRVESGKGCDVKRVANDRFSCVLKTAQGSREKRKEK